MDRQFLEKLTNATQELINQSISLAQQEKNPVLVPVHTINAGLSHEFITSSLEALGISINELRQAATTELAQLPHSAGTQLGIDQRMQDFFKQLDMIAQELSDEYISLEHVMLAWAQTPYLSDQIRSLFKARGFTKQHILAYMQQLRKGRKVESKTAENQYQALEKYCTNITKLAREGKLDPVIGRHEEIRRVMQILSRRTKNNPVLIGEPGVGKTAIVEGIAQRIIANDVPESLQGKKMYALDLGRLIAGAKYQGEFEDRLKSVLKEIEDGKDHIILFIDELHMLIGAGAAGGGAMDASNLLKPALARGMLHCIGATTLQEYKKYIEKDAALERRFQKVFVPEPTIEDAISILRGLKERFELHHGIRIKDQAIVNAVQLAAKNITERFLPDKAIDLIDEAAAAVKIAIDSQPESIDRLDRKIRQLEIEKLALAKEKNEESKKRLEALTKELAELKEEHAQLLTQWKSEKEPLERLNKIQEEVDRANYQYQLAEREGDYARASEIKYGTIAKLERQLEQEKEKLKTIKTTLIKQIVDEHDVAKVLSRWTGIPVEKLETEEKEKLLHMPEILQKRVVGQDEAIEKITQAVQLHRAGLTDPNRPIGSFLFLGPTGVGKTEVAKTLADFLFNNPHRLVRIDMSEYMERHSVARLIGAPPGYVGYEEGGQLTEQVRRHPYSVILFDEIEKAHPEVFNLFLQILDDGRLTDNQGRTVSFKNTIIIMTSNIGSDLILQSPVLTDKVKTEIEGLLYKTFRPEFLNRIDAIVFFKRLDEQAVEKIAHIQLDHLKKRLAEQDIVLHVSEPVISWLAEKGYNPELGARPLKRVIQKEVTVPISQHLLKYPETKTITLGVEKSGITLR